MIKQRDRRLCLDVASRRGAECNTDHHLVCPKLWLKRCQRGATVKESIHHCVNLVWESFTMKRWRVKGERNQYLKAMRERADETWPVEDGMDEK